MAQVLRFPTRPTSRHTTGRAITVALSIVTAFSTASASIGPRSIERDRHSYGATLAETGTAPGSTVLTVTAGG